jgi:hypothetical protein
MILRIDGTTGLTVKYEKAGRVQDVYSGDGNLQHWKMMLRAII